MVAWLYTWEKLIEVVGSGSTHLLVRRGKALVKRHLKVRTVYALEKCIIWRILRVRLGEVQVDWCLGGARRASWVTGRLFWSFVEAIKASEVIPGSLHFSQRAIKASSVRPLSWIENQRNGHITCQSPVNFIGPVRTQANFWPDKAFGWLGVSGVFN